MYEMGDRKYSFIFYHKLDMLKVMEGGPWSFEQSMLVLHQVEMGEDPIAIQITNMEMWVQIYDMPRGFVSENILQSIGAAMGKYVKSDPGTFEGGWKPYIRIRVAVNVEKPLTRRMKIKREGNQCNWINFKYEKLCTFCFVCDVIGHSERECDVIYANPEKLVDKAYGSWLRAPGRGTRNNAGARWIRNAGGGRDTWGYQKQQGEASTEEFKEGYKESDTENVVIDSKRKRVNNVKPGENNSLSMVQAKENQQGEVSKNLQMAGAGVQARQII